jgi:hypothetical protein
MTTTDKCVCSQCTEATLDSEECTLAGYSLACNTANTLEMQW